MIEGPEQELAPLTVVLLNYDGGETLLHCARSLAAQTRLPRRLLVVDNGSRHFDDDGLRRTLGPRYQKILKILRIAENVGYARGMNHGIEAVLADPSAPAWLMTLSNDTELEPHFFEAFRLETEMLPPFHSILASPGQAVGMLAPKLRSMQSRDLLDGAGIAVSLDGMSSARGQRERDESQYDSNTHILIPNGVAAIYRTDLFRDVGLLDGSFWAYCEDTDIGLRAWLAGWDCRFLPECIVYHARGTTLGEHSLSKLYYVERNHYWVAIKNLPLPFLLLNPSLTSYRFLVQAYALLAGRGQGSGYGQTQRLLPLVKTTLKAMADAFVGVPGVVVKRVKLRRLRRRSSLEVLRTLWAKRLSFHDLILK